MVTKHALKAINWMKRIKHIHLQSTLCMSEGFVCVRLMTRHL